MKPNILIIDDEENIRELLIDILEDEGYKVFSSPNGKNGLDIIQIQPINLVFLDVKLPDGSGLDFLLTIKKIYPNVEVIIISGHASIDNAVFCMKSGAFDVLEKPLSLDRIIKLSKSALRKNIDNTNVSENYEEKIIGSSLAIQNIRKSISIASNSDVNVFIEGDNGTGKDLIAKQIHKFSKNSKNQFITINCAALPEQLIESELFGYKKGSFTGAMSDKKGKFELANNGTLFLDEVADLSMGAQAKILNAIENKSINVIGDNKEIKLNIRFICATNKDMQVEMKKGNFRQDLYYRLYVFPIKCTPLSQRKEDIIELANYFIEQFNFKYSKNVILMEDVFQVIKNYNWLGNVRELKNFIERIVVVYDNEIGLDKVKDFLDIKINEMPSTLNKSIKNSKGDLEKQMIIDTLKENNNDILKTSKVLGISLYNLNLKIKKYDIIF